MESTDLRKELECSTCRKMSTDPVTLTCGHNICRECIGPVLNTPEGSGGYFCPECREEFQEQPTLPRNMTLHNREIFLSAQPDQESEVLSTSTIPQQVQESECMKCEASVCDPSPDQASCDPTTSPEHRKCSVHNEPLTYYCTEESICICLSCKRAKKHRKHKVETLKEASEQKKKQLRRFLYKLMAEREETEIRIHSLPERRGKVQGKADDEEKKIAALFSDIRRRLEDLEKRVRSEISLQADWFSIALSNMIQQLEIEKEELSRKVGDAEKLCDTMDPLTFVQQLDAGDLCDTENGEDRGGDTGNGDRESDEKLLHDGWIDVSGILHTGLPVIVSGTHLYPHSAKGKLLLLGFTNIVLNASTASKKINLSDDRKTASFLTFLTQRGTPERFLCSQVLSSQSFSSGRHYWEVDVERSDNWRIGMCYASIDRIGKQSTIGYNNKSWVLERFMGDQYSVVHDWTKIPLPDAVFSNRFRVDLDYEAGRISFYDMSDPIRHLYTFTTTFTEPLHAGIGVGRGCIRIFEA